VISGQDGDHKRSQRPRRPARRALLGLCQPAHPAFGAVCAIVLPACELAVVTIAAWLAGPLALVARLACAVVDVYLNVVAVRRVADCGLLWAIAALRRSREMIASVGRWSTLGLPSLSIGRPRACLSTPKPPPARQAREA
jgi:hypothetical protein